MASKPNLDEMARDAVERIRLIPDWVREFTEPASVAASEHRISKDLLELLLDLGLPSEGTGDDRLFDGFDLANASVSLDLPCPRRLAMRWWSKTLAALRSGPPIGYTLEMSAGCPSKGHVGPCEFTLGRRVTESARVTELAPGRYSCEVELPCEPHTFGEPFTELIGLVGPLRFHLLPVALAKDVGFVAETKMADCRSATIYLNRSARALGLPVRPALGYFVAPPYATPHCWLEFRVDGHWVTADPFLLHSLADWGIVDPGQWPVERSPQGVMWRGDQREFVAMEHNGVEVYPTITMTNRWIHAAADRKR
jgi:hypothetical protein